MSEPIQVVIFVALAFLFERVLKPYRLRKWLGVAMIIAGLIGSVALSRTHLQGFDLGLMSALAVLVGIGLFLTRRRFE
ncbi:hypothetical protein HG549_11000 [Pseudomonas sp. SK]|uniref:hypothetical protein n=1 Tax=Pseudomonas sp. SK TaxID=2729423 RepID=UPI0014630FE3|nr:hypothetical protein [Pseudomonas sp. SK]QJQ20434.1 hypothetical protein HG549_11000 [Pseudomonas sp. SK]